MTIDDEKRVVAELLWEALDGGHYDLTVLKAMPDDAHFVKDIGIDSLDLMEFILRVEERFSVKISDDDYSSLTSVSAVAEFLQSQKAEIET